MAKKSSIEKNERRRKMAKQFAGRRKKLKAIVQDKTLPVEDRFAATLKLAELPRNSSRTRIRTRSELPGRPRAFDRTPVIREIERASKPGRRVYASAKALPRVNNGLGIAILSTP